MPRKRSATGLENIADHLKPLGLQSWIVGKKHFGLGTAKIDLIPDSAPGANGSNQVHSFDGVEKYISQARQDGIPFA